MLPMEDAAGPRLLASCGCSQPYHEACLRSWFRVSPTCPTCRAAVLRPPSPLPSPRRDEIVVVHVWDDARDWPSDLIVDEVVVSRGPACATDLCCCCTFFGYLFLTAL